MIDGYYLSSFFKDLNKDLHFVYPIHSQAAIIYATTQEDRHQTGVLKYLTSSPQQYCLKIKVAHHPDLLDDIHSFIAENVSTPWQACCVLTNKDYHTYYMTFADEPTLMAAMLRLGDHHPTRLHDYYLGKPDV